MNIAKNTNVGSVFFKITSNRGAFTKEMKSTAGGVESVFGKSMKAVGKTVAAAFSVAAVVSFGKKCVQVASETQSAWMGLSSILNGQGKSFSQANSFIQDYIKDGLVPLNNAVTAYKNLAARGYDTKQIESTLKSLKDAAAFGRQASYSMGDAVQSATEGLKNENSILVDNAGVTKNVSKMWEDYAKSIGTTSAALTQQQKIQAEVNGILQETKWQTGDAARYSETFAGKMAKITATTTALKTSIGNMLIPILNKLLPFLQTALDLALKFCNSMQAIMASLGWEMPDVSSFNSALGNTSSVAVDTANNVSGIGTAAEKAAKKAKNAFAAYDEINVLNKSTADTSGASSGAGVAASEIGAVGNSVKSVESRIDALRTKLMGFWNGFSAGFASEKAELDRQIETTKNTFKKVWADLKSLGTPIKNWATTDLKDYFETACHTYAGIFLGLYDSANMVFSDLWNFAVFPNLQKFVTVGLPVITQFSTEMMKTLSTSFGAVKELFDNVWSGGAVPALKLFSKVYSDVWDIVDDKWKKYGEPVFTSVRDAITNTKNIMLDAWNGYIKPCWDALMDTADEIWTDHLKPLCDNIGDFVGELVQGALDIYNKFIYPVVSWIKDVFYPVFVEKFKAILNAVKPIITGIIDYANGILTKLKGIIQFITGVFTGDWQKAWTGIKNIFSGIWQSISAVIKTPLNAILALVENAVNRIISGINVLIRGLNKIKFDVPDWVPGIGGKKLGFNINQVSTVKLPRLANGGWVAANNPQLAVIGDNKREGEIVTPESKIREQVEAALAKFGGAVQRIKLELELIIKYPDGRTIIKKINEAQIAEGRILLEI